MSVKIIGGEASTFPGMVCLQLGLMLNPLSICLSYAWINYIYSRWGSLVHVIRKRDRSNCEIIKYVSSKLQNKRKVLE